MGAKMNFMTVFLLLVGLQAQAQILFLDTNSSKKEIDIVRAYALAQKQELTILRGEEDKLPGKVDDYLSNLAQKGQTLKIFIASGHSNGEMFFGVSGKIQNDDLGEVMAKHFRDDLKTVILLGCYTNTPGNLFKHWLKLFPAAKFIAGYESIGASNVNPAGLSFLKSILDHQNSLLQQKTDAEKIKLINQLNLFRLLNASLYLNGSYFSNDIKDSMEGLKEMCKNPYREELLDQYKCYWSGVRGCENPPANTHASILRDFYKYIQLHAHCSEEVNERYPWVADIVSLIHYRNVVGNFMKSEASGVRVLNQDLQMLGLDSKLQMGDLRQWSRGQVIERLNDINKALGKIRDSEETKMQFYQSGRFNYVMQASYNAELISKHLIDFSQAPLDWVEPMATPKSDFPLDRAVDREPVEADTAWGYMLRGALYQEFAKEPEFQQVARKVAKISEEARLLENRKNKLSEKQKEKLKRINQQLEQWDAEYQGWVAKIFSRALPRLKEMVSAYTSDSQIMNHYQVLEILQYKPATAVLSEVYMMRK